MRRAAWVVLGVGLLGVACTSRGVETTAASGPTTVPTTTSPPSPSTPTTAPGPVWLGFEIHPAAGKPGEPLVVCGWLPEGSPVRVIFSDPGSGDRWPDGVGGWSAADQFGRWCWTGTIPRELQSNDPSTMEERRPIVSGVHEIRAESLRETVGYGTLTVHEVEETEDPSQALGDARRDGIVPALAELPLSLRVESLVEVPADEGTWVLSVPAGSGREAVAPAGGRFGDWDGDGPGQVVDLFTYGEILLVDRAGTIVRAYPMPDAGPDWIYLTPQAVYAGNIGDGAYPDSTLVRIDRSTLGAEVVVVPCPSCEAGGDLRWPDTWQVATEEQALRYHTELVRVGQGATGLVAACWKGRVVVDPAGIDELLTEFEPKLPELPQAFGRDEVPWEQVGAGWYVVLYDSSTVSWTSADDFRHGPVGLYLVDTVGHRYEMATWPADDRPFAIVDAAGTSVIVMSSGATADDVEIELVDLVTGGRRVVHTAGFPERTLSLGPPARLALPGGDAVTVYRSDGATEWLERRSREGDTLAVLFEQPYVENPSNLRWMDRHDGESVLVFSRYGVVEVTPTGEALGSLWAPADTRCDPIRWWDGDTYLAACYGLGPGSAPLDSSGNPHTYYGRLWLLETDGSAGSPLTSLPADPPFVGDYGYHDAWPAGSGTLLQWSGDCGASHIAVLQPNGTGAFLPMAGPSDPSVDGVEMVDVIDGVIAVLGLQGCGGESGALYAVDLAGSYLRDLFPTAGDARGVLGVRGLATIYP